jgi:hypothetical protein
MITVTATDEVDEIKDKTVTLTPYNQAGGVMKVATNLGEQVHHWKCESGTIDENYLPGTCK